MLDITSYRRKQKYVQPLTVMREMFYDYGNKCKNKMKISTAEDPLARRTLSVQKFNKCLKDLRAQTDRDNQLQQTKNMNEKSQLTNYQWMRSKRHESTDAAKRQTCYFKQLFSSTAPFIKNHPSIERSAECKDQNRNPQVQLCNLVFSKRKVLPKNHTKLYRQMCDQKQQLEELKQMRKQKYRQIRKNWIIRHRYIKKQNHILGDKPASIRCRLRQKFQSTKQNIFPQTPL